MGAKWYNKQKVKCPLYQYERENCIVCEGVLYGSNHMTNYFDSAAKKRAYQEGHCYASLKENYCPIMQLALKREE